MSHPSLAAGIAALVVTASIACAPAAFAQGSGSGGTAAPQATAPGTTGEGATGTRPGGNGVIRPPTQLDPGIKKSAPQAQTYPMPVVPPPGTPGGKPDVVAK